MYSNPRALSEIKAILATVRRAEGNVDLDDISGELEYRARVEKRSPPSTAASSALSSILATLDEGRLARHGLEESDAHDAGEVEDSINEV